MASLHSESCCVGGAYEIDWDGQVGVIDECVYVQVRTYLGEQPLDLRGQVLLLRGLHQRVLCRLFVILRAIQYGWSTNQSTIGGVDAFYHPRARPSSLQPHTTAPTHPHRRASPSSCAAPEKSRPGTSPPAGSPASAPCASAPPTPPFRMMESARATDARGGSNPSPHRPPGAGTHCRYCRWCCRPRRPPFWPEWCWCRVCGGGGRRSTAPVVGALCRPRRAAAYSS